MNLKSGCSTCWPLPKRSNRRVNVVASARSVWTGLPTRPIASDALLYMATTSIYPLPAVVETMDHRLLRQLDRGGHDAGLAPAACRAVDTFGGLTATTTCSSKEPKCTGTARRGLHAAAPERRLTRPPLRAVPTTSLGTSLVSRPLCGTHSGGSVFLEPDRGLGCVCGLVRMRLPQQSRQGRVLFRLAGPQRLFRAGKDLD
jgi:hypothetical protein